MPKLILRLEPLRHDATNGDGPADSSAPVRHVVDLGDHTRNAAASTPLARWSASVAAAHDACLVVDGQGRIVSLSASGAELLGCSGSGVIGRHLLDVVELVDFDTGAVNPEYAARIAPLGVIGANGLMRSLVRVRHRDGSTVTIDASSAPLHDAHGDGIGSITFVAAIRG